MSDTASRPKTPGMPTDGASWRKIGVLMTLMMAHDLPNTLTSLMIPTVFTRRLDMPIEWIGLFSIPLVVTALKWMWAPVLDRHGSDRIGWRKSWLIPCCVGVALSLAAIGQVKPSLDVLWLVITLLVIKQLFFSTYEIAGDAYIVENVEPHERGFSSSMIWLGREIGQFVGFAGLMVVTQKFGWTAGLTSGAVLFIVFSLPIFIRREPVVARDRARRIGAVDHLRGFFSKQHNLKVLLVVFLVSFAVQMPVSVIGPFLGERGLSLSQIGIVIGAAAGIGAMLSLLLIAPVISRLGVKTMAIVMLFIAPLAAPGFLWIAQAQPEALTPTVVGAIIFIGALCTAPVRMIVYAARIGWTSEGHVGAEFTLQQSTWFLGYAAAGVVGGLLAGTVGWFGFFIVNTIMQITAVVLFIVLHDGISDAVAREREATA
ncbi:MAG: MFS transporter [Pseudomonadota bacterium]